MVDREAYFEAWKEGHREHLAEYNRQWYAKNKERLRERRHARWKIVDSKRQAAYVKVRGLVPLPWCQVCGKEAGPRKTEAHHADYSRPDDVVWLCRKHHKQLHAWLNSKEE